jgi:hypothetical protein
MMGSGTTLIEAATIDIHSVGFDASPFCQLMARAKAAALSSDLSELRTLTKNATVILPVIQAAFGDRMRRRNVHGPQTGLFDTYATVPDHRPDTLDCSPVAADIANLAYLDSVGFAARRANKTAAELFEEVLNKYLRAVEKFQSAMAHRMRNLGNARAEVGDARALPITDGSVDGVVFSPPYSFAIDYVANDAEQLARLGYDTDQLRETMIGLRGTPGPERVHQYFDDMASVMAEIARVLRPGRYCSIVVGSNRKQLARILDKPEHEVEGIEDRLVQLGDAVGLSLISRIERQITGMANALRNEHILIFRRTPP